MRIYRVTTWKNKGNSREIKGLPRFPETVRIGLKLVILAAYHEIYQIIAISQKVKKIEKKTKSEKSIDKNLAKIFDFKVIH